MRDARFILILFGGLLLPFVLVWWINSSQTAALLIVSAPWLNWSIYTVGALCGVLLSVLGSYLLRSYWLLVAAMGVLYWAAGCLIGGLQAGTNPLISPAIALPYIRGLWLLGSSALIVSAIAVAKCVVRIEPTEKILHGLDTDKSDNAASR